MTARQILPARAPRVIHGNAHHLTNDPAICDEVIEVWEELRSTWAQLALGRRAAGGWRRAEPVARHAAAMTIRAAAPWPFRRRSGPISASLPGLHPPGALLI